MTRWRVFASAGLILLFGVVQTAWPDGPLALSPTTSPALPGAGTFGAAPFGTTLPAPMPPTALEAPTSQPATAPATRSVMSVPPGMHVVTVSGHTALCDPKDDDVVRLALASVQPATRPTTGPSEILARLDSARPVLVKEMATDLGVGDDAATAFLDQKFTPALRHMADLRPRFFFLVATHDRLTAAMKAGWRDPRYHYNPLADQATYQPGIIVNPDREPDDIVLWAEIQPGMPLSDEADVIVRATQDFDARFAAAVAIESRVLARNLLIQFIGDQAVASLKLPPPEQWFGLGLMGALSSKYAAAVTGEPRAALLAEEAAASAQNPLDPAQLDLLHPLDPASVKPRFLPFYLDALSRKSTAVVGVLLDKAGDGAAPKLLQSLRTNPPADNDALVKTIKDVAGVDLKNELSPPG